MSRKRCSREMAATGKKVRAEHTQLLLRGERDMGVNKIYRGVVMVAVMAILVSSAQAAITIQVAEEVQNGMVVIKGKGAARGASITWARLNQVHRTQSPLALLSDRKNL